MRIQKIHTIALNVLENFDFFFVKLPYNAKQSKVVEEKEKTGNAYA